jgi:glycosyltransferase involved in cell wall biosynthesis
MDAWVLHPEALKGMKVAHWLPVDCSPLSVMDQNILSNGGGIPIAMSQHGRREMEAAGFAPLLVPHGIDCQAWQPLPDRDEIRAKIGIEGKFLIGINAANADPVRKGYAEQMQAFAVFRARHPEAMLLIHARAQTQQGCDLYRLAAELRLGESVVFADQYQISAGLTKHDELARWYGLLDVLSNCSYGEGFGLPVMEAQACGTPVVVTDCSAMTEIAGPGWLVEGSRYWNKGHGAFWLRPDVDSIVCAYERAFEEAASVRLQARRFALLYDADRVLEDSWVPALKELEDA